MKKNFLILIWTAICFIVLLPILVLIINSFKTETQLFNQKTFFLFIPTLQNYTDLLTDKKFSTYFFNSLIIGVLATCFTLILGSMAAYGLKEIEFKFKQHLLITTLVLRILPPAILIIPVFYLWNLIGIADTQMGLIVIYIALNIPFVIWILYAFLDTIPKSLIEAAKIDGCNHFKIYTTLILPLIKPGLIAAGIFVFRVCWNEFILALILTNRYSRTLPVYMSLFISEHNIAWGEIMAMGVLVTIPSILILIIAYKYIVTGFSFGGIKG
tara:strand:- start:53 stop:862 length:810 start_codon:yes stop_codon:yes gene_type:complete